MDKGFSQEEACKNIGNGTGISYEPWHFRYVGLEAAQFMREHDLTLEEFYVLLEN